MVSLLLAVIYLAFISLGLPDSLVGAGWPAMHGDLHVPLSFAGFVTLIIALGTICSSLASERLTRRFGAGIVTAVSVAITAIALLGFSMAGEFWVLCFWAIPYGLGAGAVDAALNNYVALHWAACHMNWLHSFWGVGASVSPFIMGFALSSEASWPMAYRAIGVLQVVIAVAIFCSLPLWNRPAKASSSVKGDGSTCEPSTPISLSTALRIPGVPLVLGAFFAYCALEGTAMLWAASYLVEDRGIDEGLAATFASLFLLGITAGRFLAGFFADRIGDTLLIRGGFLLVGLGVLMLGLPFLPETVGLVGLALIGLGSAPIYPAIIHATPSTFGARNSQAIIGVQMAAAYTGTTIAPPLFGGLAAITGMEILPMFLGALVLLGLGMSEALGLRTRSTHP